MMTETRELNVQNIAASANEALTPINKLTLEHYATLAKKAQIVRLAPHAVLYAEKEHDYLTYVLRGSVVLTSSLNTQVTIAAGSKRSKQPLFSDDHQKAKTEDDCTIVRFNKKLFASLLKMQGNENEQLDKLDIDASGAELFAEIYQAYVDHKLKMPSLPDIALKIRDSINNSNHNIDEINKIIQIDPALSVRLVQVANSPAYRGLYPVRSIKEATTRLGLRATQTMAFVMSVNHLFSAQHKMITQQMQALYNYSSTLAALSFVIADKVGSVDKEQALLAGLISHIGVLPVLQHADTHPKLLQSEETLKTAVTKLHAVISGMVLKHWDFEANLANLPSICTNDFDCNIDEELTLCDILKVSKYIIGHDVAGNPLTSGDIHHSPLWVKLVNNGVKDANLDSFLLEANEDIKAMKALLQPSA